jgi:hypothetical protein
MDRIFTSKCIFQKVEQILQYIINDIASTEGEEGWRQHY